MARAEVHMDHALGRPYERRDRIRASLQAVTGADAVDELERAQVLSVDRRSRA